MDSGQIILLQTQGGETKTEVRLANESVWLTADRMAVLFQRNKSSISRHIKNILESGVFQRNSVAAEIATTTADGGTVSKQSRTVAKNATVRNEGDRKVERNIAYNYLACIINAGYRFNAKEMTACNNGVSSLRGL